ncbi:MAG: hypothetical protein WAM14_06995 [Candidatus Nitrosopolaris sp.]
MIHKTIAISVIAPVAVAGILTLAILAAISSTNQAFAQAKPTALSLGAYPNKGKVGANTGTLPVSLSGQLTSEGSGVAGATISFSGVDHGSTTTDSGGHYGIGVRLGPGTHTIEAHYSGDSDHESSSATKVIPVTP